MISRALKTHQRNVFDLWTVVNDETYKSDQTTKRVTTVLSHKWGIYITSLQGAGHHCSGSEKIVKVRGQEVQEQMGIFWT